MFERQSEEFRRVTMLLDLALTVLVYLLSLWLRQAVGRVDVEDLLSHVALLTAVVPLWIALLPLCGAYRSPRTTTRLEYTWAVTRAVAAGLVSLLTLLFFLKIQHVSRGVIVTFAGLDLLALIGVRMGTVWYFRRSLARAQSFLRVLIVGTGNRASRLAEALIRNSDWGIHVVGHLDPEAQLAGGRVLGAPVLGSTDDISSVLRDHVIDHVIIALPRGLIGKVEKVARACEEEGVRLCMMADIFDLRVARMSLVPHGSIPLLAFEPVAQDEGRLMLKRVMDLAVALAMLPLLLPVMAIVALAIRLDSPGPVFFAQERVGLVKRRFKMLKFRTMVDGAESMQKQFEHLNEAEGPIFKIADDPRITRVGRVLRRTSLDELPQIFNIITGEMSFVGPRPMSVRDVQLFDRGIQRRRFSVKPGLTCLWQVSGRSLLPFSKWLELDLYYIDNWSLALDLKILLRTVPVILRGTGAV